MTAGRQLWLFEWEDQGGLAHVSVRCGSEPSHRPLLGTLRMSLDEWKRLAELMRRGALASQFVDDDAETEVEVRRLKHRPGAGK